MKKPFQRIYPHIKNGRFYNYANEIPEGFLFRSLFIYFKSYVNRFFYHPHATSWKVDVNPINKSIQPVITWIGHSTFLIQIAEINILTDPIFGDATSLFPRILEPGIALSLLPKIDFVLISHNHLDHMDAAALTVLKRRFPECQYLVPLGDKKWFDERGFTHVREYTWWQQDRFSINRVELACTFLPAFHWSQRTLFDKNRSLWGSWMINVDGCTIYFAGDTAYSRHFKIIGQEFDHIDCAIIPIGPCEPHNWMKLSHANAHEAYQGFRDLKAYHFIPMHWGTFYFGTDHFHTPLHMLENLWKRFNDKEVLKDQLHIMRVGQRINVPRAQDMVPARQEVVTKQP